MFQDGTWKPWTRAWQKRQDHLLKLKHVQYIHVLYTTYYAMCEVCMLAANRIGILFITLRDASQCSSKYNFNHMLGSVPDMVPAWITKHLQASFTHPFTRILRRLPLRRASANATRGTRHHGLHCQVHLGVHGLSIDITFQSKQRKSMMKEVSIVIDRPYVMAR